jgi:drug/metabolite transporter (DMT)-like permease
MMLALTYLPLATANAVVYAAPLIMLPLSIVMLSERPGRAKVIMTIVGFIGVLIVLRPSEFHWASLCALVTATTLALFNIMARKIPSQQSVVTTLFWTSLLSIPVASIGAGITWQVVSMKEYGLVAIAAALILLYNGLAVLAYKKVKPADIAMSEYSGLAFVTLIGIIWFDEIPSLITGAGILLIVLPLLPKEKIKQVLTRLTFRR